MMLSLLPESLSVEPSLLSAPASLQGTLSGVLSEFPQGSLELTTDFYVGWGTLALVNAGLAQGKGRSGLAWFLVSLLLGPIATFFIVALDRVEE